MSNGGSGCVVCPTPDIATCNCAPGQPYDYVERTCTQCRQCICRSPSPSSVPSSSGGGGSSTGVTAGAAVGGVLGVAAALFLLYWFWWKPKGLAASRKRYSKHLSHRQSKLATQLQAHDKKRLSAADALNRESGGKKDSDAVASKRTSVHLSMEPTGDQRLSRRMSPAPRDGSLAATGGHSSRTSLESDNPFGDHNRSSIGTFDDNASAHTSDFSFRSSHSTNIIPIAYIPPHSNSVAVEDAQRGAYGEILHDSTVAANVRPQTRIPPRISVPTSMASRDSLVLSGGDLIDLHPLPPVLTPGSPVVPLGASSNGAPIRPPRSPGLDLQLPSPSPTSGSLKSSRDSRIGLDLRPMSMSGRSGTPSTLLSGGGATAGSPTERTSHLSTISSMSAATSRSGSSTMSYILDPPQIITPVNAQGLKRVEVLGPRQAGLVRIPGSAAGSSPTSPAPSNPPTSGMGLFSTLTSSGKPNAQSGMPPNNLSPTMNPNPFGDDARARNSTFSVGEGITGKALAANVSEDDSLPMEALAGALAATALAENPNQSTWTLTTTNTTDSPVDGSTASPFGDDTASIDGHLVTLDVQPPSPSRSRDTDAQSIASSFDVPQSARSSNVFDDADEGGDSPKSRRLTGESAWAVPAPTGQHLSLDVGGAVNLLRPHSTASSFVSSRSGATDSMSMLDGIPFMGPSTTLSTSGHSTDNVNEPPSPLFPTAPGRAASYVSDVSIGDSGSPSPAAEEPGPQLGHSTSPPVQSQGDAGSTDDADDTEPLPLPFLPFAGQRPTSLASNYPSVLTDNSPFEDPASVTSQQQRDSHAISVRSGFGSGLSQIPFQLDGGLRDSMMLGMSDGAASDRGSVANFAGSTTARPMSSASSVVGGAATRLSLSRQPSSGNGESDQRASMQSDSGLSAVREGSEGDESKRTSFASVAESSTMEVRDEGDDEQFEVQVATRQPMIVRTASVKRTIVDHAEGEETEEDPKNPFGDHANAE
ncbi:hypothetical protein OIO90_004827 [Microbotryomycetes sp. JL221]|nr:hypothetical protein OIO90_004827 [Microbotryomycetes sp. JL221]